MARAADERDGKPDVFRDGPRSRVHQKKKYIFLLYIDNFNKRNVLVLILQCYIIQIISFTQQLL